MNESLYHDTSCRRLIIMLNLTFLYISELRVNEDLSWDIQPEASFPTNISIIKYFSCEGDDYVIVGFNKVDEGIYEVDAEIYKFISGAFTPIGKYFYHFVLLSRGPGWGRGGFPPHFGSRIFRSIPKSHRPDRPRRPTLGMYKTSPQGVVVRRRSGIAYFSFRSIAIYLRLISTLYIHM